MHPLAARFLLPRRSRWPWRTAASPLALPAPRSSATVRSTSPRPSCRVGWATRVDTTSAQGGGPHHPPIGDGEKELGLDKVGRGRRGEAQRGRRDTTTKHQTCVGIEWGGTRRARVHTTPSAMRRRVRDRTGAKRLLRGGDGTNRTEINASTPSAPTLRPAMPRWRPVPWEDQTSNTLGQRCTNERACDGKITNAQGHFNPTEKMGKHSFAPMRRMDRGQHQLNAFGFAKSQTKTHTGPATLAFGKKEQSKRVWCTPTPHAWITHMLVNESSAKRCT